MKIAVLTSSRADYSIYYPLLQDLRADSFFSLDIIAFGTHLSKRHGHTLTKILEDGFEVKHTLKTTSRGDSPGDISESMGKTLEEFSSIWRPGEYDMVFALGDRYEMFAACASTVPFNIPLAHIHGGEETLGAIDNAFRHAITHMAKYHFTAAEPYRERVATLKNSDRHVYNTGALSLDNLRTTQLLSVAAFQERFKIDLSRPSILITFHPETVSFEKNEGYVETLIAALQATKGYQFIITMPNADTLGNMIRSKLQAFIAQSPNAVGVESFGTIGYLSCMQHCSFMLGNTSSGFIEAAYFPKYVINLGARQAGRILTPNITTCNIEKQEIHDAITRYEHLKPFSPVEIYGDGTASKKIISILKEL